jgi:crotonobetainyl-CoA:carnitine CoA-transferase CaiB-like acyl-CoA transferase
VEKGQLMRFPWAEVCSIPGLLSSPQLKASNFWVEIEHPETGKKYKFPAMRLA